MYKTQENLVKKLLLLNLFLNLIIIIMCAVILNIALDALRYNITNVSPQVSLRPTPTASVKQTPPKQIKETPSPSLTKISKVKPTTRKINITATGYCSCVKCCGKWSIINHGITFSGKKVSRTGVAAPEELAIGTRLLINGKTYMVTDRGGAVVVRNGVYRIDFWFPTHEEATRFGLKKMTAEIL